jgi:N-acetylmuramoyl-L-alanine amidase
MPGMFAKGVLLANLISVPVTLADVDTMARTIYGEAAHEPWSGKLAVAWVIRNRAEIDLGSDEKPDWWGEGIAGVCLKRNQFSCWREVTEQERRWRNRLIALTGRDMNDCLAAAMAVLLGTERDLSNRATHYFADYITAPAWSFGKDGKPLTPTAKFGVHQFYRLV